MRGVKLALVVLLGAVGLGSGVDALAAAPNPVVGTWLFREQGMEVRAVFGADGRFTRAMRTPQGSETVAGRYLVGPGVLQLQPDGGMPVMLPCRMPDAGTLVVADPSGAQLWMRRQAAAPVAAPDEAARTPAPRKAPDGGAAPAVPAVAPAGFEKFSYVDQGGIRDYRTGRFLEAFSLQIPKGWRFEGGISWVYATKSAYDLQPADTMFPARSAWKVLSPDGRCAVERFREELWCDLTGSATASMGLFPPGSNYRGMTSCQAMAPQQYALQFVAPRQRGLPPGFTVVSQEDRPELAAAFEAEVRSLNQLFGQTGLGSSISYRGGSVVVDYDAGGVPTREAFVLVLQYCATAGLVQWWPAVNFSLRAPRAEWVRWQPVLSKVATSIVVNARWKIEYNRMVAKAGQGQAMADDYVHQVQQAIADAHAGTNTEVIRTLAPLSAAHVDYVGPGGKRIMLETGKGHAVDADGNLYSGPQTPEGPGLTPLNPDLGRE